MDALTEAEIDMLLSALEKVAQGERGGMALLEAILADPNRHSNMTPETLERITAEYAEARREQKRKHYAVLVLQAKLATYAQRLAAKEAGVDELMKELGL